MNVFTAFDTRKYKHGGFNSIGDLDTLDGYDRHTLGQGFDAWLVGILRDAGTDPRVGGPQAGRTVRVGGGEHEVDRAADGVGQRGDRVGRGAGEGASRRAALRGRALPMRIQDESLEWRLRGGACVMS